MPIFARCSRCSLVFESSFASFFDFNNAYVSLYNNAESCPRCGSLADIDDGLYLIRGTLVQALSSFQRDTQLLSYVASLAKQVSENSLTPEIALKKASEASPAAAITLRDWMQFAPSVLMVLLTVIQVYLSYMQGKESVSEKAMQHYVDQAISEALGRRMRPMSNKSVSNSSEEIGKVRNTGTQEKTHAENRKARRAQKSKIRNKPRNQN